MLRVLKGRPQPGENGGKTVSSFGAFTISAAARVGTGNIAGVATAITLGGAGAVSWMWVMAVIGGVKRISSVTTVLVPVMAVVCLLLGSAVVLLNLGDLPRVFGDIVGGAFGFRELAAGGIGAAIQQGIRRGMFSNEAGLGSAPNAGATAEVSHPVKQGLVQSLGFFFDTLGGWAGHVLTLVVFMLAFSSMIGNYYYGQSNIEFMTARRRVLPAYRALGLDPVFTRDRLPDLVGVECREARPERAAEKMPV
ncbi:alanine:cation symporter family protein [Streptomyces morookaense]|uniref:alanine:cation symporter family protein n=1 Tax=Streptomyces morookaense TaxID=1970 RepID=UPI0033ECB108